MHLLPLVRQESVRLILSDPPYNVSRENNFDTMGRGGIEWEWDGKFDQLGWLELGARALMPGGSFIIWNDWKNLGDIARHLNEKLGFEIKDTLIWTKTNPMPRNTNRRYVPVREYALWAVKPSKKNPWVFNKREGVAYERGEFNYPVQRSWHPSKKPDGLFEELISIHSNAGDLVLDPFVGGGTTPMAAQRTGRNHISFELRRDCFDQLAADFTVEFGVGQVTTVDSATTS
jgi:site-specific DNA-methyltransferase (adenine-specific)